MATYLRGQYDFNLAQQSALTTALTNLIHTSPGTPDYNIQNFTQITPFGFKTSDEANTVLKVVKANQIRIAEIETKLQAIDLLA